MRGNFFQLALFLIFLCLCSSFSYAQTFESLDDLNLETKRVMDEYPAVKLRSLDKVTARTQTFEASVGSTVKFGPIYIKVQACRKSQPIDEPESAAFLQIWEITPEDESRWVFSGWMFASSPALSSMDHPVFDVWVLNCIQKEKEEEKEKPAAEDESEEETEPKIEIPSNPE